MRVEHQTGESVRREPDGAILVLKLRSERMRRMSAQVGEWLLKCAVGRGATHYEREFSDDLPSDNPALSDEELGVALCLGQHDYNPVYVRAAAQLLSSSSINAPRLCRFALMERVESVLFFIAHVAERFAPPAEPWRYPSVSFMPRFDYLLQLVDNEQPHLPHRRT